MYQEHWGISDSPFMGMLDPKFFYQSPTHDEALARLHFLVEQRRRLGVLVGPSGSGKSLLLEVFCEQLRREGFGTAKLSLLGVEPAELLWRLASDWHVALNPTRSLAALWRTVGDRLCEYRYQRLGAVVLLDDVDQAEPDVMRQVMRLVRFDPSPDARLTIVLAGRNEGVARLDPWLLDRVDLRIELEPWDSADLKKYLTTSLAKAGRKSPVFAESGVARLHELSHGIPRRAAQLADLALVAGAGQELKRIDADVVEEVFQELSAAH
ncbi:MAG: AAA family ATPase [Planctomycetaceae bacterium]|nr:AAA family ATPase [Planctomycetaceae bacterium]